MNKPAGWDVRTLGEIATIRNGLFASRPNEDPAGTAILRISAVRDGYVNINDRRYVHDVAPAKVAQFAVAKGDLLLTRYNGSRQLVGIAGIVPEHDGHLLHPDKLIRVLLSPTIADSRFINYQLASSAVRQFLEPRIRTTAGQSGISGVDVKAIPVRLAPIEEQRRIVDILEDHLSRLAVAEAGLDSASRRASLLTLTSGMQVITGAGSTNASRSVSFGDREVALPRGWQASTVGDEASLVQYGTSSKTSEAAELDAIAVLRMGNLQRGAIVTAKLKYLPRDHPDVGSLLLQRGDLLFNRTNSAELVGKSAVFDRDDYSMTFASYLIRVRFGPAVRPAWANLVINSPLGRAYVGSVASQQVGQANVNGTKLKAFPLVFPPLDVQDRLLARHEAVDETGRRLMAEVAEARQRTSLLRRTLLQAAFTGSLTGTSSDLDRAEESIS